MSTEDGSRPPVSIPGFVDEIASGSRVRALTVLRDKLAAELDLTAGKDSAPLARELGRVLEQLEKLGAHGEVTPLDDIAGRVADEVAAARARRSPGTAAV